MKRLILFALILTMLCCLPTALADTGSLKAQAGDILIAAGYESIAGDLFLQPMDAYSEFMPSTMATAGDPSDPTAYAVLELTDSARLFRLTTTELVGAGDTVGHDTATTAAERANSFFFDYALPSEEEIDDIYIADDLLGTPTGEAAVRLWIAYAEDGWDYDGAEVTYAVGCVMEIGVNSGRIWRLEMDWPQEVFDALCGGRSYLYE